MKNLKIKSVAIATFAATLVLGAGTSFAAGWGCWHPRRAEVNSRLRDQNYRINQGVRDGQLSPFQARQLRTDDRSVLRQEDLYAHYDGGAISRPEQETLNQEENGISRQIYVDRHDGAVYPGYPFQRAVYPGYPFQGGL